MYPCTTPASPRGRSPPESHPRATRELHRPSLPSPSASVQSGPAMLPYTDQPPYTYKKSHLTRAALSHFVMLHVFYTPAIRDKAGRPAHSFHPRSANRPGHSVLSPCRPHPLFCALLRFNLRGGSLRAGPIESIWGLSWAAVGRLRLIVPLDLRIYRPIYESVYRFPPSGSMRLNDLFPTFGNSEVDSVISLCNPFVLRRLLGLRCWHIVTLLSYCTLSIHQINILRNIYYAQISLRNIVHSFT